MDANSKPNSPYVGLIPYSDHDANFFFGREVETEIIAANLRSARLTVLYGTSGVGKSSVLQAGVVHNLRELIKEDLKTYGQAEFAIVTYRNWASDPIKGIAEAVRKGVAESLQIKSELLEPVPETGDLVKILQAWSQRYSLELLIILDQFEEIFNYLTNKNSLCAVFADQLAEVIKAPNISVRFLISLRDDTLSRLDYFKESIPGLFDNRLELHRLTASNARRAITKPIDAYNDLYNPETKFKIEKGLVDEVVEQIKPKRNESGEVDRQIKAEQVEKTDDVRTPADEISEQTYVETPNLQLVMKRIWREEVETGSNNLRMETLTKLGGVDKIIQTHLDEVMNTLTSQERRVAFECFDHLVTPMETKVAMTVAALDKRTDCGQEKIKRVMEVLIKGKESNVKTAGTEKPSDEARVLRAVEISVGKNKSPGYEVTHDAYIPAILSWRTRYQIKHNVINQLKTKGLPVLIVLLLVLLIFGWRWIANLQLNTVLQMQAVESNSNRLELEKELGEESLSQKSETDAVKDTNDAYKELIAVLINLSSPNAKENDAAYKNLQKLIEEKKVPEELEDSLIQMTAKIDKQKALNLRKAALDAKNERQSKPQVYIHITDENQRTAAQLCGLFLGSNGFNVSGIENVGAIKGKLSSPQIRFFRPEDQPWADKLRDLLATKGIANARPQFIEGYANSSTVRPKQLELWFTNDPIPIIQ